YNGSASFPAGPVAVAEDTDLAFDGAAGANHAGPITVTDVDVNETPGPNNTVQVALAVGGGTLTLGTTAGLVFGGGANGSAAMTVTGTLADVNAALATLTYRGDPNFNGPDTLTVTT